MTEDQIEQFAIQRLSGLGYAYQHGPGFAHDGEHPERASYEQVLLLERLRAAVRRINPRIPTAAQEEAVKQVARIASPELLVNNEVFHRMLTEGVKVDYQQDGNTRGDLVWLVDFAKPANNDLLVVNQYTVVENGKNKRPDVLLFVNGLPLVLMELKNAADEKASIRSAYKQVETYKETIPGLFTYNCVVVISDGLEAKAGTVSSGYSRFMSWKTSDGKEEASPLIGQLETLIVGMLNKETLLDLVRHFIVFERSKKEDPKTGVNTITTVKKIAAYHQYYAVNRAVASTLRAAGFNSPPAEGWPQAGVVNYAAAVPPLRLAAEGGNTPPRLSGTPPEEGNNTRPAGTPPEEGNFAACYVARPFLFSGWEYV
jgi:type I restriction enzyme R subunit